MSQRKPEQCPVCGSSKIRPASLTNNLVPDDVPETTLLRFTCDNGHAFYVPADPSLPSAPSSAA